MYCKANKYTKYLLSFQLDSPGNIAYGYCKNIEKCKGRGANYKK